MLSDWASMKRVGVNCATTAVSGKEFRESGMEIIEDEGGNNILFAIWDDKEVASADGIEVVLPSRTWVYPWLGAVGTGSASFYISVHGLSL